MIYEDINLQFNLATVGIFPIPSTLTERQAGSLDHRDSVRLPPGPRIGNAVPVCGFTERKHPNKLRVCVAVLGVVEGREEKVG